MDKRRLSIFFLLSLCFVSTREQHAVRMPEWGQHIPNVLQRLIVEHKKLSSAAILAATVLYQLRAKWNVKIIKDRDQVYEDYKHADPCSIFNEDIEEARKNLVFYFGGHRAFAKYNVFQQTAYGGNPLTEQFKLGKKYGWKEGGELARKICEVMVRFEETILNREYRSYFGQMGDVVDALVCLRNHYEINKDRINIVGRSRGGHVAAIILGLLACPNNVAIVDYLRICGIDEQKQLEIRNGLKGGHIIFCVPLIDMPSTLKETRGLYGIALQMGLLAIVSGFRYGQGQEIHAIDFLNRIVDIARFENPGFKITVIFANRDKTVGVNEQLRNRFIEVLGNFGVVNRIDVPGGHNDHHQRETLLNKIVEEIIDKKNQ